MAEIGGARTWKLVLSYDGGDFHGWQVQPALPTVQGELRAALARITGEEVLPQGSGRTDAGVHALCQVASFALSTPIPEANLVRALNRTLPAAIRVRSACLAPAGFHARHSALAKTYEYRIYRGEICPPWLARYAYAFHQPLDCEAMQRAAQSVLGERDFTSFAAGDPDLAERAAGQQPALAPLHTERLERQDNVRLPPQGNVRILYASEWLTGMGGSGDLEAGVFPGVCEEGFGLRGGFLTYRVRGNGFLHHMVRNLVGTFLEIGRGSLGEDDLARILAAQARAQAGPTAPARGLFLCRVEYPENLP